MNSIRSLEILGIVLFRFSMLPRIWAILLILVNAASLLFIHTSYGQVGFAAVCAAILVMAIIYARLGFVRLLGVGHIFWVPMLIWFGMNLPNGHEQPLLYSWVICLMIVNSVSLVIDAIDVARFISGERQPHYRWTLPVAD